MRSQEVDTNNGNYPPPNIHPDKSSGPVHPGYTV